ncbi:MAG: hypothetical protein HC927_05550 [Deltaproteobacteria bacterium]|nr:hypothetical protein [Deltaproteobacteria bacterium]
MDADPLFLRAFEIVGLSIYAAALIAALRRRHPVYLGLFFACNTMIFWDWVFNCKWFFNVRFNENLTKLWTIHGESETLAGGLAFVAFYYWVFHLLWRHQATLDAKLGNKQFVVLYLAFMAYVLVFESLLIRNGLYRYYQKDEFLLFGATWSNLVFNANLSVGSYVALRQVRKWGKIPDAIPFDPRHEEFWKGFWMPGAAIWTAFWLSFVLQMIWYMNAQPWAAGPRAF